MKQPSSGLALLEVLVALVVLSLVAVAYLQLFQGAHLLVAGSREWSEALAYATDGMERAKLSPTTVELAPTESLPGGFRRETTVRPWQPGLELVTVTILLPDGARFELPSLERSEAFQPAPRGPGVSQAVLPW